MKIRLDLSRHCIETEVKRLHETAMSRYFKGREDKDALEAELVLLERALAAFDFERLRGRWPILSGGADRPVYLTDDDDGNPSLRLDDQCIVAPVNEPDDLPQGR